MAVGSTIKTIGLSLFRKLTISHPRLAEQRKIAEILRTWDDAIEHAESLVKVENAALGALRRQLFNSVVHDVPLSEVSRRITTKSDGASHTVMAISARTGFVSQADKYRRDMAGASVANYTLLRRGEFAYNKGNSLTYPQGCIYALKVDSALVPNVYYSFRLRADLNSNYYEHFFASGALNRQLAQRITSGVRGNGLLNLNANDFFDVKVPIPDRATQDGAANALNAGARRIELLKSKVELLRIQKRGLMQKLLTGQVRVHAAADTEMGGPRDD
jgi:type I restriction enzyme S subunit